MINKKLDSFLLAVLFLSANFLNLSANESPVKQSKLVQLREEPEQENIQQQDDTQQEGALQLEKLMKEFEELSIDSQDSGNPLSQDFFKQPAKMAERLPEACKKMVLQAWDSCNNLLANLQNPILFLFDVVQNTGFTAEEVRINLTDLLKELFDSLVKSLISGQRVLGSQGFQLALQFGTFNQDLKEQISNISQELESVLKRLEQESFEKKDFFINSLQVIKESFNSLVLGDFNLLAKHQQAYLQEKSTTSLQLLSSVELMLDDLFENLNPEDKELEEAIVFWQETLKEFDSIKRYFAGPSKFIKAFNVAGSVAPYLEGGYFFYRIFMQLYKTDNKDFFTWTNQFTTKKGFLALLGDQTFRLSMIPIHFLRRVTQLGKSKNISFNQDQFLIQQIIGECFAIYMDPNFCVRNLIWPARAFYRILPALTYIGFNEGFFPLNAFEKGNFATDEKLRRAVWFSLKDGYRSLAYFLEGQMHRKIDPEKLRKLEEGTLGIIKPELLSVTLDTIMPLLTHKYFPKSITGIEREDVFAKEFSNVQDYFWDWNYVGKTDFKKVTDASFLEGRILGYLATSLGNHFGRKFVQNHKRPIKSLLSKGVKGCSKVLSKLGFLDEEYIDWQDQIREEIKDGILILAKDPALVILIQQFLFPMLVAFGIMNQLEVAQLEKTLISGEQLTEKEIDLLVNKIFSSVADKLVISAGGWVGSFISWSAANWLMKNYGPFYPRAENYIKKSFA